MCSLVYKDNNILFFLTYLSENNRWRCKIIIKKKDIKHSVDRNRMKRKMRFLFKLLNLNDNLACKIIVKNIYEFKIDEYILIKDKIIKNAFCK